IIPDQHLSEHVKCIFSTAPEILNGDIKQSVMELAQQLISSELADVSEISLKTIMDQGVSAPTKALKSISARLPDGLRLGFNFGIEQLSSTKLSQEQIVKEVSKLYNQDTANALQTSFNVLTALKTDKLQALRSLVELVPDERAKAIFDALEHISKRESCDMQDVIKTTLELASIMAPKKMSETFETIGNVYVKIVSHQEIDAIKDALRLLPFVPEQAHHVIDSLTNLSKQEITAENVLSCAFDTTLNIVDPKTAKALRTVRIVIDQVQNHDVQGAVHSIASEFFPEYATRINTAMEITSSITDTLSRTNDPLQALDSLMNNEKLKSYLPSEIQNVYDIAQELRSIIDSKDIAKEELTKRALQLGASFLPPEHAKKVNDVVKLIDAVRSDDPQKILDQSLNVAASYLPPEINNHIQPVIPIIRKKLNNQKISYEDVMDVAGSYIGGRGQQIINAAKPFVSALINGKRLSGDQYLDLLDTAMTTLGVKKEVMDIVHKAKTVYKNVRQIQQATSALMKATTIASKAAQISSIAAAALSLLTELIPDLPEDVKTAIDIIAGIALLLTATNPVGLVLAAIGLVFSLSKLFGGGKGGGGGGGSGGKSGGAGSGGAGQGGNSGGASGGGTGGKSGGAGSGSSSGGATSGGTSGKSGGAGSGGAGQGGNSGGASGGGTGGKSGGAGSGGSSGGASGSGTAAGASSGKSSAGASGGSSSHATTGAGKDGASSASSSGGGSTNSGKGGAGTSGSVGSSSTGATGTSTGKVKTSEGSIHPTKAYTSKGDSGSSYGEDAHYPGA
ncbi:unnamed protein product, partial [Adineta ricciae]